MDADGAGVGGHKPFKARSSDDLPAPLGPVTRTLRRAARSVRSRTSSRPSGVRSVTSSNSRTGAAPLFSRLRDGGVVISGAASSDAVDAADAERGARAPPRAMASSSSYGS